MRHLLLTPIFMILLSGKSFGQMILEHTFTYPNPVLPEEGKIVIPNYLSTGLKYFEIDNTTNLVNVYNSDYSFHSIFTLPVDSAYKMGTTSYFTDKLFDLDDDIEVAYYGVGMLPTLFGVYNHDGSTLFESEGSFPITELLQDLPDNLGHKYVFFSESDSTFKIALKRWGSNQNTVKIYSLPGTPAMPQFSCCCAPGLAGMQQNNPGFSGMQVYPNPSGSVNIVQLPENVSKGEIIVYNMQGDEIKRIAFTANTQEVEINNTLLASGTYFYKLSTSDAKFNNLTKKILIIQ